MMKLLNHNAWTNGPLLNIDSLGAGGSKEHLILFNTQQKLGHLMSNSELWDLIDSIGNYEHASGLQRNDDPIKIFEDEHLRIDKGGKVDKTFLYNLTQKQNGFGKVVRGEYL